MLLCNISSVYHYILTFTNHRMPLFNHNLVLYIDVYNLFSSYRERQNSAVLVQADLSFDVSKTAQRVITEAVGVWGRLDVLVNNASQFFPTRVDAVTEQEWTVLIQANLTSSFFLSQVYWTAMSNNFLNFWFIIFKLVFVTKLIF